MKILNQTSFKIPASKSILTLLVFASAALVFSLLRIGAQAALILLLPLSIHTAMVCSMQVEASERESGSRKLFEVNLFSRLSTIERQLAQIESRIDSANTTIEKVADAGN